MIIFIFIVGLLVSTAVCYALFAYTIHEMGANERETARGKISKPQAKTD